MAKQLPIGLQRSKLQDVFCNYNEEDCGTGVIDWKHALDSSLSYAENRQVLRSTYPGYNWDPPEKIAPRAYDEMIIEGLREEADPLSYTVVKKLKVEGLERDSRRAKRLSKKLEDCEAKPIRKTYRPGTCKVKTIKVKSYSRCKPRK